MAAVVLSWAGGRCRRWAGLLPLLALLATLQPAHARRLTRLSASPVGPNEVRDEPCRVEGDPPQVQLLRGLWLVPGSETVIGRRGRPFQCVDGDPGPGEYAASPAGTLTFNPKDRGARVRVSYRYRSRVAAILPIATAEAPPAVAAAITADVEQEFRARGYDVAPRLDVQRCMEALRVYTSGQIPPDLAHQMGRDLGAQDLVVLRVSRYQTKGGKSLFGFFWTGPFGGGRKQVTVGLAARILDAGSGRTVWQSESLVERQGSHLGSVGRKLRSHAINSAVTDLFRSYFEP